MNKNEISQALSHSHEIFADALIALNAREFTAQVGEKWTPAQHLEHLYKSVAALDQGLMVPKFAIRLIFGKANRPSRNYEGLVAKYNEKLQAGGRATGRFVPPVVAASRQGELCNKLTKSVSSLNRKIAGYSEEQLDSYILPHPLLGKLTLREMLYFTIYHVVHHRHILERDYSIGFPE